MDPAVEDRCREDCVGATVANRADEVRGLGRSARRDDGNLDAGGDRPEECGIEPGSRAVAIDRCHQQLARAKFDRALGPADRVQTGRFTATLDDDLPALIRTPPRIHRDDDRLASESRSACRNQRWIGNGGRVERHLVGARPQHIAHVLDAPDATANRQRAERPAGRPFDDVEQRPAALGRGRDVEEDELVRALVGVALRELRRITLVDEIDEPCAFHDPPVRDIEARDDPPAKHQAGTARLAASRPERTSSTRLASRRRPSAPLRSGWNCTPRTLSRAIALTNEAPWPVRARVVGPRSPASSSRGDPAYEWTK